MMISQFGGRIGVLQLIHGCAASVRRALHCLPGLLLHDVFCAANPAQLLMRRQSQRCPFHPSEDTVPLKELTERFYRVLPQSSVCTNFRGNGGAEAAVCDVQRYLGQHFYVFLTHVKSYYMSIDHNQNHGASGPTIG